MPPYTAAMFYKTLKNNSFFLVPYLGTLLMLLPFLLLHSKPAIHLWINEHHSQFFDCFFKYITFLGDGVFIIIPAIFFLFFSLRHVVFLLTAYFSTGLFAQILKRIFFDDIVRPARYFHEIASLHLVDGVKMLGSRSFPSGHSTSAFALFLCLALISPNRFVKFTCFIAASVVAFSRVYLSQHFLIDIMAGSIIGAAGALAFHQLFYRHDRIWHAWTVLKPFKHEARA